MARKHVFIIHGWGKNPPTTWADPYKKTILDNLRNYSPFKGKSDQALEKDWVEIIPLSYDSVFDGYRTRWKDLAGALKAKKGINGTVKRIVRWVANSGDQTLERVFWDYILDAVLWMTLPEARKAVVAKVNAQLATHYARIFAETGGQPSASIIAYSLGTSVIHDSLVCLQNSILTSKKIPPANLRFVSISMLGNVSRLLQSPFKLGAGVGPDQLKVYTSQVLPGLTNSLAFAYLNYHHKADPFTWPRQFNLIWTRAGDYRDTELLHYDDLKGVHDFDTYLDSPWTHVTLFKRVFGDPNLFGPQERDPVIAKFKAKYDQHASNEFDSFRSLFQRDPDFELTPLQTAQFLVRILRELQ